MSRSLIDAQAYRDLTKRVAKMDLDEGLITPGHYEIVCARADADYRRTRNKRRRG